MIALRNCFFFFFVVVVLLWWPRYKKKNMLHYLLFVIVRLLVDGNKHPVASFPCHTVRSVGGGEGEERECSATLE